MASLPELCEPRPAAMISSLRAFGYDLPMAIADLIDNSIFAHARNITVEYDWNNGSPWFRILDDGNGMTEERLREAMRLGSQSPLEKRHEDDLGRFGLGLKTASFSQCKLLTVYTKICDDKTSIRSWDLDHVCDIDKWEIATEAPHGSQPLLSVLEEQKQGTVILCQKLDRLSQNNSDSDQDAKEAFLESFGQVARYLEMVFHRFLTGRDRITISVGRHICEPWDPFLSNNEFTQPLSTEYLDKHQLVLRPYVLPHVSKRSLSESEAGAGLYGWNAHQGFYVYRNKRMIIHGGYLDLPFKAEEHYKLCRIQLDIPNNIDHEWMIDVRKAVASPPSHVRNDLIRIVRASRDQAAEIYRARVGGARRNPRTATKHDVWVRKRLGEKIVYQINPDNEAIKRILSEISPSTQWVKKLFQMIERTVPHRLIIIDNAEHEDCHVNLPPDLRSPSTELIELCSQIFREQLDAGLEFNSAADFACSFFDNHPAFRAALDKIIEEIR